MSLIKRMLFAVTIALALLGAGIAPVQAQEETPANAEAKKSETPQSPTRRRKRVAVVNFEIPESLWSGWGGDGAAAAHRLSQVLSDMFTTALVKSGTFDVIERAELERILKEQKLGADGLLDPATAPKVGKILGVDYILGGKITEFGLKTKGGGGLGALTGGFLGVDIQKSTARAVIDARMIDTTTAKVLLAEQGTGENSESKFAFAGSDFSHFLASVNFESSEWTDSRIGRATRTAVEEVIGKITTIFPVEANVRAVLPNGSMILDLGRFSGIKVGDEFDVLRVEQIIDEDTGEVIYEERKALGTIKVAEVQDSACKCTAVTMSEPAKKGDLAVLKRPKPAEDKGKGKGKK
jgi:curli biogenesis system outer membrane secretion channel CsgG